MISVAGSGSGGRASRLNEELGKPDAFGSELINARCRCPAQFPTTVHTEVAVAEIVRENEYDVGLWIGRRSLANRQKHYSYRHDDSPFHGLSFW